jgi:hypothetical protein
MPITFKSKHAPDILMFESIALQLIKAMGHSGTVPGAVAAEDVSAALQHLEQKLAGPDIGLLDNDDDAQSNEDREPRVSMAHRSLPLINMLRSAIKEGDYIIWDR